MANSKTGGGKVRDEHGTSCYAKKYGSVKKQKVMGICQKNTGPNLKGLPLTKVEQFAQYLKQYDL